MMPGPDQVLITRNVLAGGRLGGLSTKLGGAMGLTVHASAAAFGLRRCWSPRPRPHGAQIVGIAYLSGWDSSRSAPLAGRSPTPPRTRQHCRRPNAADRPAFARASCRMRSTPRSRCSSSRSSPSSSPPTARRPVRMPCCTQRSSPACTSRGSRRTCWSSTASGTGCVAPR